MPDELRSELLSLDYRLAEAQNSLDRALELCAKDCWDAAEHYMRRAAGRCRLAAREADAEPLYFGKVSHKSEGMLFHADRIVNDIATLREMKPAGE